MKKINFFLLGILVALGALIIENVFSVFYELFTLSSVEGNFIFFVLLIASTEELLKYLILWKISSRENSRKEILLFSLSFALGFFFVEALLNSLKAFTPTLLIYWENYLIILVFHFLTAFLLLSYFSYKKFLSPRNVGLFLLNFSLHILFNLAVFHAMSYSLIFLGLIGLIVLIFIFRLNRQKS